MSEPTRIDFESAGGVTIAAYRWDPAGEPRAIVQIAHGVGEYARRYEPLVQRLTAAGFVVCAHDHRGHGNSAASEAEFGQIGADGWTELVDDLGRIGARAKDAHPGLPLALVAHSLGSFATQQFLLDHSAEVDAVVLSGTAVIDLLEPAMDLDAEMDLSAFNAPFQPARTEFDWLSRDEAEVDKYIADPWCGFGLDVAGAKQMFVAARRMAEPEQVARIRSDLPVLIVVGDADPVNGGLALAHALVGRLGDAGVENVTLEAYPGARHEVFNETNRDEVFDDVVGWLDRTLT